MKTKFVAAGLTSIAVASLVGMAGLSFSPIACGCESVPNLLLASAGLPYPADLPGSRQLEDGLDQNLKGSVVKGGGNPYYFGGCKQQSPTQVQCHVATSESKLLERGYDITFETDTSGKFIKSHVSSYTSWR